LRPEAFLADPQAQDLTAQWKITQLLKSYTPEEAAVIWFTGASDPKAYWQDVYGTNAAEYRQAFIKHYKSKSAHEYALTQN